MVETQTVKFDMYEMSYKGGNILSDLSLVPFEEQYYEQYKNLINSCFYEMRKALNIQPYGKFCESLEELKEQKKDIFLLFDDEKVICTVSCLGNEIGSLAVDLAYQRQGYGRKLMEFALSHMQSRGDSPIKLTVTKWNRHAIALYERLGFEITKETTIKGISTKDADGNWHFAFTSTGDLQVR